MTLINNSIAGTYVWECGDCGCFVVTPRVHGFDAHNSAWESKHWICLS